MNNKWARIFIDFLVSNAGVLVLALSAVGFMSCPAWAESDATTPAALVLPKQESDITSLAFSKDGRQIAVHVNYSEFVQIFDSTTGEPVSKLRGKHCSRAFLAFSPDGKLLAMASNFEKNEKSLMIWDVATGKTVSELVGLRNITGIAFSPDGNQIVAGGNAGIFVWDVYSGKLVRRIELPRLEAIRIALSPDGKTVAAALYPHDVLMLDIQSGAVISRVETKDLTRAMTFSPDGQEFVILDGKGIHAWNATAYQYSGDYPTLYKSTPDVLIYSPDGKRVATGGYRGEVIVWDAARKMPEFSFKGAIHIASLAFSPDSNKLASGESLWYARVYSLTNSEGFDLSDRINYLFHAAISSNDVKGVRELLSKKADISAKDKYGRDAINAALQRNFSMEENDSATSEAIGEIVKARGIDRVIRDINNRAKTTPSQREIMNVSRSRPLSLQQKQIIELLLDAGARVQSDAPKMDEFVSGVMTDKNTDLLKKLTRAGLDVNANCYGRRLLELAVANRDKDAVAHLLSRNAEVNFKDGEDNLVFLAISSGDNDLAKTLYKSGVKLPDIYAEAASALKKWRFDDYEKWLKRGVAVELLNSKQQVQLEAMRLKENRLYLAEQERLAEQARQAERRRQQAAVRENNMGSDQPSGAAPVDYVSVEAEMTCGFLCNVVTEKVTLSGGPGYWNEGARSGTITKGYNGIQGWYEYYVRFSQNKSCSGRIFVSGFKRNLKINVNKECQNAGTWEGP